ncbi:MAG: right-handed parallel beta-helix repeat-containing protein [Myxococcales bacterium]
MNRSPLAHLPIGLATLAFVACCSPASSGGEGTTTAATSAGTTAGTGGSSAASAGTTGSGTGGSATSGGSGSAGTSTGGGATGTGGSPCTLPTAITDGGLYVDATLGAASNNGRSPACPLPTLQACADLAAPGATCHVAAGTYRETVVPPRSGLPGQPIAFVGSAGAVVSGTEPLINLVATGDTGLDGCTVYAASPAAWPAGVSPDAGLGDGRNQLFLDGGMLFEARWPTPDSTALGTSPRARFLSALLAPTDAHADAWGWGLMQDSGCNAATPPPATQWDPCAAAAGGKQGGDAGFYYLYDSDIDSLLPSPQAYVGAHVVVGGPGEGSAIGVGSQSGVVTAYLPPSGGAPPAFCVSYASSVYGPSNTGACSYQLYPGAPFFLAGSYGLLTTNSWVFPTASSVGPAPSQPDAGSYFVCLAGPPAPGALEAKVRGYAFDLRGRAYVSVRNLDLFAAGIWTGDGGTAVSDHLDFENLRIAYPTHFTYAPPGVRVANAPHGWGAPGGVFSGGSLVHEMLTTLPADVDAGTDGQPGDLPGVILVGTHHTFVNNEIAYSAGDGLLVNGTGHTIAGNVIHEVDYAGYRSAAISTGDQYFPIAVDATQILRNTLYDSRSVLLLFYNLGGGCIALNDLHDGCLSREDCGLLYARLVDGATDAGASCLGQPISETRVAYNWVHGLVTHVDPTTQGIQYDHEGAAIYLDDFSHDLIVDHNVTWGAVQGALLNNPWNVDLYNNTLDGDGGQGLAAIDPGGGATTVDSVSLVLNDGCTLSTESGTGAACCYDPRNLSPGCVDAGGPQDQTTLDFRNQIYVLPLRHGDTTFVWGPSCSGVAPQSCWPSLMCAPDAGSVCNGASPDFAGPGNYALAPGSPAIDAGVAVPPWTVGLDEGAYQTGDAPWDAGSFLSPKL